MENTRMRRVVMTRRIRVNLIIALNLKFAKAELLYDSLNNCLIEPIDERTEEAS